MTADLDQERHHLIQADRHLTEGEQRITAQLVLIERLGHQGSDTTRAEELLRLLEDTMALWQDHRQLILEAITRYEQAISPPPQADPGPAVL
ncbi:hypothetical protein ACETIH_17500 [Microvirga arabica]|uniref:Uncharacterized protein n=1 Tax=Microvirga arabica TaxID=1128671 RepID=A0ABV6YBE3_9HYPH